MGPSCVENDLLTRFRTSGELKDTSCKKIVADRQQTSLCRQKAGQTRP